MIDKLKKAPIRIIVFMTASLLLAVICIVYSVNYQSSLDLSEKYGDEKELAISALRSGLSDVSKDPADGKKHFLLASYDTENRSQKDIAYSYDNALCALAFMADGDKESAAAILDAFVYAAVNDRGDVCRVRNAYAAGEIVGDICGSVRLPGYYDSERDMWIEDPSLVGSSSGNLAWVSLALLWYDKLYGEEEDTYFYVKTATALMDWILDNCSDENAGFIAGINGWPENDMSKAQVLSYKSLEHNVDCMAVFDALYEMTGDERYSEAARSSEAFIQSMYDAKKGYYYTGTSSDGVTPSVEPVVLDAQVWTALALDDAGKNSRLRKNIGKMKTSDKGYAFCLEEAAGGFWAEGTAFTALYYLERGKKKEVYDALSALSVIQRDDGRIPACSGDSISTGMDLFNGTEWVYDNSPHIAPAAWLIMAVDGFNPFDIDLTDADKDRYEREKLSHEGVDVLRMREELCKEQFIIHAAGRYVTDDGEVLFYTNSLEALERAYDSGSRMIEIDFLFTSDGYPVCAHNADGAWALGFSFDKAPTHEEFMNEKVHGCLTPLDIYRLADFMRKHRDMYVVTDIKGLSGGESAGTKLTKGEAVRKCAPDLMNRFIIQIYHDEEYDAVKGLGFPYIIYTLYAADEDERNPEAIVSACDKMDIVGLTMPAEWVDDAEFAGKISKIKVPLFVHTINDEKEMEMFKSLGISGFYTDVVRW